MANPDPALVAALERELAGYLQYGNKDQAAEVEAELKALGKTTKARARPKRTPAGKPDGKGTSGGH